MCRVNAINVGWTLTDNEDILQRVEMDSINWIEEADQVQRVCFFCDYLPVRSMRTICHAATRQYRLIV